MLRIFQKYTILEKGERIRFLSQKKARHTTWKCFRLKIARSSQRLRKKKCIQRSGLFQHMNTADIHWVNQVFLISSVVLVLDLNNEWFVGLRRIGKLLIDFI